MTANVPTKDMGSAMLGMMVAERFRRNRKMTSTTSMTVSLSVNLTSSTEARIDCERSYKTSTWTDAGISDFIESITARMEFTTLTVFVPGWRKTERLMERVAVSGVMSHAAVLSFSTLSTTAPKSLSRTGAPLRYTTTIGRYCSAVIS